MNVNSTTNFRSGLNWLSRNNTNNSSTFNWYLAILEWADGTVIHRETINNHLLSLISDDNNKKTFNSLSTLREKIAFIASLNNNGKANETISQICEEILVKIDLSESAIIRLSALNRFNINISTEQNIKLLSIENILKKIVAEKIPSLLPNLHLRNETTAQRIQKTKKITQYLIKKWLLEKYPEWYEEIAWLLNPLHELDDNYHILNHARNTFYNIQKWYDEVEILSSSQSKKLENALSLIVWNWTTLDSFFRNNIQSRFKDINLISLLEDTLSNCPDAEEKLKTINLNKSKFERYFLYYFSTEMLYKSKINLDRKKSEIFKDKKREFELDIKKYREIQVNRLISLSTNINTNLTEINSIFERDRKLFLRTWNQENDQNLQNALIEVLKNRYPNTDTNIINQLAQAIMDENQTTNELYYGNTNYFQNDSQDTGWQQLVKTIWNTGRNIKKIWTFTTPIIWWFVKLTQKTIELWWKTASNIINWTTQSVKWILDKYNTWANSETKWFIWSIVKFPFKASQILTRPLWWWANWMHFITSKTTGIIQNSYNWINESIKSASNQEIENLFDVFTKTYKHSVSLLWSWTAWSWDKVFDMLKTQQKREILWQFYESKSHQEVSSLLEAIDIQSVMSDSSPYIFDDNYIEDLWYDVVKQEEIIDNSSEEIKLLKSKIDEVIWDLASKKTQDEEIYWEIIDWFHFIKRELNKEWEEKDKLQAIKSKIDTLIQTLKTILEENESKIKILKKLWLSKKDDWNFEIQKKSFLWHLQTLSKAIYKTGTIKNKTFKDAVLSLSL